ncbi:hypothetical protein Arcpr_0894 [Archaeoglobus profundus DSM 5631]|uniref:Uncharacterized protein n=1 Tax=Archaeoglobus profundus (strain DSM 5631 / JCM 9629 / NBRC 100127 / Av18) TaxID=572546 RepID=D2RI30_ARCPA|nr:hypothetical protein Arcpr_0894 [Archaeoglobus profundus DSM 5631]
MSKGRGLWGCPSSGGSSGSKSSSPSESKTHEELEQKIVHELRKGTSPEEIEKKYGVKIITKDVHMEPVKSQGPLDRVEAVAQGQLHPVDTKPQEDVVEQKVNEAQNWITQKRLDIEVTGDKIASQLHDPVMRFGARFTEGLALAGLGFASGLVNVGAGVYHIGKEAIHNPVQAGKDAAVGFVEWVKSVPERLYLGFTDNPFFAGQVAGEIAGGEVLGRATTKVVGGPLGKAKALVDMKLNPNYIENPGIKFVPDVTYEPATADVLVKQVAGRKATLVHMTEHPTFSKAKVGEEVLLEAKPEYATGWRKEYDALHWYQSAPSPEGEPLGYLAYVGIGRGTSESVLKFSLTRPKKTAVVTHDYVNYIPPRPGESFAEYQVRTGQLSGETFIPGENVFGLSTERQVITPARFRSNLVPDLEYPGTILKKVRDVGFTYYKQSTLPDWLEGTRLGRALQKLGYGEKYHKIHISEWEKIPVKEGVKEVEVPKEGFKELDVIRYNEEYGRVRYITPYDVGLGLFRRFFGASLGSVGSRYPYRMGSIGSLFSDLGFSLGEGGFSFGSRGISGGGKGGSCGSSRGGSGRSGGSGSGGSRGGSGGSGGGGSSGSFGSFGSFGSPPSSPIISTPPSSPTGGSGMRPKSLIGPAKTEKSSRKTKERYRFWLYIHPVATPFQLLGIKLGKKKGGRNGKKGRKSSGRRRKR